MAWCECKECDFTWGRGPGSKFGMGCPRCDRRAEIADAQRAVRLVGNHNSPRALELTRDALQKLLALIIANDDLA